MTRQFPRDQIFISKLTEIIRTNLGNENFNVKELAYLSGMNLYGLNRRLFAITNKTARQFIRETRLQKALEILQNEELTAAEVAYKVGFSSPAYFNTCFHEYFGYPPGKIKKAEFETTEEISTGLKTKEKRQKLSVWRVRRTYIILSAIFLIAFLAYPGYNYLVKYNNHKADVSSKIQEKSIAVLPFKNLTDSTGNQYFIDGLMEEILTNLSRIHDLRVTSRTSVEQFRRSAKSASEIAKKLNVDYIVEGSGQKYGNFFRLRVQLIEASKDKHLWAESYEQEIKETKDIFKIQSEIAQSIVTELNANITSEEKQLINKTYTTNLTALDFFQRGDDELNKYFSDNNLPALKRAEEMYCKALEYDSTYARAYCGLAEVIFKRHLFDNSYFSENYLDSALILANRALSYDDRLAEGYYFKGRYYLATGNTSQAAKEFEKAIKYNPNFGEAYNDLGYHVYIEDFNYADYVKGLQYIHKAVSLEHGKDRARYLRYFLGDAYGIFAGFPDKRKSYYMEAFKLDNDTNSMNDFKTDEEVIEALKKSYAKDSNDLYIMYSLVSKYTNLGQYKNSLKFVKKIEKFPDGKIMTLPGSYFTIGYVYMQNGFKGEATYWFNKQVKRSEESLKLGRHMGIGANLNLATTYTVLGEKAKAYENLRIVAKPRVCGYWLLLLLKEPCFNNIRNELEFQNIAKDLEAKYQVEHERVRRWLEETGQL